MATFRLNVIGTTKAGLAVGTPDLCRIIGKDDPAPDLVDSFRVITEGAMEGYLQLVRQDAQAPVFNPSSGLFEIMAIQMTTGLGSPNSAGVFQPGELVFGDWRTDWGQGAVDVAPRQEFLVPGEGEPVGPVGWIAADPNDPRVTDPGTTILEVSPQGFTPFAYMYDTGAVKDGKGKWWVRG